MESRIACQLADKIGLYLSKRGIWDFGKSEKRRRDIRSRLNSRSKPLPITKLELVYLQQAATRRAVNRLFSCTEIKRYFPTKKQTDE